MHRVASVWTFFLTLGVLLALGGCGDPEPGPSPETPRFVTTIPPFEMMLKPLVDGRATVVGLLEPGSSPHTYDPTPSDVRAVANATALVYGAEHLDGWAADLPVDRRLGLVDLLPKTARLTFHHAGPGSSDAATVDPHFWTDPLAVASLLPVLVDTLCAVDAAGCSTYRANADSFGTALAALDARLQRLTAPVRETPVLLAQPFFRYFLHRYGPRLVGVVEPRPGTESTPREIRRLAVQAERSGARVILTQRQVSARAAAAVAEAATLPVIEIDPLGGTKGRSTYSALLLANARILRDSLDRFP